MLPHLITWENEFQCKFTNMPGRGWVIRNRPECRSLCPGTADLSLGFTCHSHDFWVTKFHGTYRVNQLIRNFQNKQMYRVRKSGFPGGSVGNESACNVGDLGSVPRLGRSPGEGKGYPPQYSGLENSIDCIVHGVTKSRARQSDCHRDKK